MRVWSVIWRILVFFVGWALLLAPMTIPVIKKFNGANPLWLQPYIEIASLASILVAAWLMLRFIDRRPFLSLGFAPRHALRDSAIGLIIGLGMMAACIAILYLCGWAIPEAATGFVGSVLAIGALATIANTAMQEVLVRGYVQQTIQKRVRLATAERDYFSSALLFLVLHLGAIQGAILPMISLFAAGILLGTAYVVTGNLWLPIALHFGWNFLQGPILGETVSGRANNSGWRLFHLTGPTLMTGGKFGVEGGLVAIIITILGTPIVLLAFRRRRSRHDVAGTTTEA